MSERTIGTDLRSLVPGRTASSEVGASLDGCSAPIGAAPPTGLAVATVADLAAAVERASVSAAELTEVALGRIDELDSVVNAFTTVLHERARVRAGVDLNGPLAGVPIAVKDLGDAIAGIVHTFGAAAVGRRYRSMTTAVTVSRLEAAGAVVVGKTTTPEFGHRATTDSPLSGPTCSPVIAGSNAGGSSGGSAAAVAAGLVPVALGSDGVGSVRVPAALCGLVGIKPTFGRIPAVSRPAGLRVGAPYAQAGPLARSVLDAAVLLDVLSGPHPGDPCSLPPPTRPFAAAASDPVRGTRVALWVDLGGFPVVGDVASAVTDVAATLSALGCEVAPVDGSLPYDHRAMSALARRMIAMSVSDAVRGLAAAGGPDLRADEWRDAPLDPTVTSLLGEADRLTVARLKLDEAIRVDVLDVLERVFASADVVLSATIGVTSIPQDGTGPVIGVDEVAGEPVDPLIGWCLTHLYNMTGHPAIVVPCGRTGDGIPVGIQLAARRFDEHRLIALGAALERVLPWLDHYPDQELTPWNRLL